MKKTMTIISTVLLISLLFSTNVFAISDEQTPINIKEKVIKGNDVLDDNIVDYSFRVDDSFVASSEELLKIDEKEEQAKKFYQNYRGSMVTLDANPYQSNQSTNENNNTSLFSSTSCVLNMTQYPQIKNYYCGNGVARSILMYKGYNCSQETLATNSYLKTEQYGNTPWYLSNGNDASQFPMVNTLRGVTGFYYIPTPYGNAGANPISAAELSQKVVYTISQSYGVAICGTSRASTSDLSHLPNYPTNSNIGHWIAANGFRNGGSIICIVDPVANSPAVSWGSNISPKYEISSEKAAAFAATKGIVW